MKKLMMIVVAAGVAICANADPSAEPSNERVDLAKTAELKGDVARARANYAAAISHYLDAVKISQHNSLLYNKLGVTELQLGDRGMARKYFAKALKIDPRNTTALNNLGAVNCIQGKYKAAIRYLKEALALDESDASAHLNIAEAWIGVGENRPRNEGIRPRPGTERRHPQQHPGWRYSAGAYSRAARHDPPS